MYFNHLPLFIIFIPSKITEIILNSAYKTMKNQRRYDIDSLRILVFIWLILYHIGMYYVADWQWHIKSEETSQALQWIMMWSSPWRMSLLFVIAGMALAFTSHKSNALALFKSRFLRLALPCIFAMYLVVAPQLYIELISKTEFNQNYWQFYLAYINPNTQLHPEYHGSPLGLLTWGHLWFLPYLWLYTMLYIGVKPYLDKLMNKLNLIYQTKLIIMINIFLPIMLLTMAAVELKPHFPQTNALVDDWYNHARYFIAFVSGFLFGKQQAFWRLLLVKRRLILIIAISCFCLIILGAKDLFPQWVHHYRYLADGIESLNTWCWILTVFAYSYRYLNKPNQYLVPLNEAILPCYILHQTIIIVLAYNLQKLSYPKVIEASTLVIATYSLCWLGYLLIRKFKWWCYLFGLKAQHLKIN